MTTADRWRLLDSAEGWAPPAPIIVDDNVVLAGDQRRGVCVELARLVVSAVVVRVPDRRERAVGHTLHATIHLERATARRSVDHSLTSMILPLPRWTTHSLRSLVFCTAVTVKIMRWPIDDVSVLTVWIKFYLLTPERLEILLEIWCIFTHL